MPDPQKPPAVKGKPMGVATKWWVVGGVAVAGIVWYSYKKSAANAAAAQIQDPNNMDPSSTYGMATDGGSSGIPTNVGGGGGGGFPDIPIPAMPTIPADATVTYTQPDGSSITVDPQQAPVTPTPDATMPAAVAPTPVQVVASLPAQVTSKSWQTDAEKWFAAHHYDAKHVQEALTRYQAGLGVDTHQLGIIETAIKHFGAAPYAPKVVMLPAPKQPKPKPKITGRQKAHH